MESHASTINASQCEFIEIFGCRRTVRKLHECHRWHGTRAPFDSYCTGDSFSSVTSHDTTISLHLIQTNCCWELRRFSPWTSFSQHFSRQCCHKTISNAPLPFQWLEQLHRGIIASETIECKRHALQLMKRWASIIGKLILHKFLWHEGKPQEPYSKMSIKWDSAHICTDRIHFLLKPNSRLLIDWTRSQCFCVGYFVTSETKWVHGVGANELNHFSIQLRFQLIYYINSAVLFFAKNAFAITFKRAWSMVMAIRRNHGIHFDWNSFLLFINFPAAKFARTITFISMKATNEIIQKKK